MKKIVFKKGWFYVRKSNVLGLMYGFVHFVVEVSCFYVMSAYTDSEFVWTLGLMFDFLAFVPQGFYGFLRDKNLKINFALLGTVLTTLALILFNFSVNPFVVIFILTAGNAMIHLHAAEVTLRGSKGKMSPSAMFVSGGSFGVITGKMLFMYNIPLVFIIALNVISFIPILISNTFKQLFDDNNLTYYNYSNKKLKSAEIIILATFVVSVRAFMGYAIPTSWNKTVIQNIFLFCCMGIGKAMGGILIDKIGIRKTAYISTVGALALLLFGNNIMLISLIGVMMFSMTMAITLALIVSELQNYPGVAFGFTTVGLFLGTLPVFFFRINSFWINCILVSVLSFVCIFILSFLCRKENNK